jgi:thiol-disulfide isomerase/thioredoxin
MRSLIIGGALAAALAGTVLAQAPSKPAAKPEQAPKPEGAATKTFTVGSDVDPNISLTDITGKTHTLKDYQGKIVVIDFWSINCPVSKAYEARLKKLHADYASKGIVFLALDANSNEVDKSAKDPYAAIKDYVKQQSVPYPILIDTGNAIADRFDAKTTPHVFILDGKGKLRYAGAIDDDDNGSKGDKATPFVRQALDALMAGKEPPAANTKPHGCSIKRVATQG